MIAIIPFAFQNHLVLKVIGRTKLVPILPRGVIWWQSFPLHQNFQLGIKKIRVPSSAQNSQGRDDGVRAENVAAKDVVDTLGDEVAFHVVVGEMTGRDVRLSETPANEVSKVVVIEDAKNDRV